MRGSRVDACGARRPRRKFTPRVYVVGFTRPSRYDRWIAQPRIFPRLRLFLLRKILAEDSF